MDRRNNSIGLSHDLPIVIVFGDGQQDVGLVYAQVQRVLGQMGGDSIVLAGREAPSEIVRRRASVQATSVAECSLIEISIVVPVYNEEGNIPELYCRLTGVMTDLGKPYELIFVDDGSRDRSYELLQEMYACDTHVHVVRLARNFGQQQAISAGLDQARGRAVIVMDADLQDPPEVIPQFIEKWRKGFQVVYAVRGKRKEHVLKRLAYHSFYLVLRSMSRINIPLEAGDFCLMDRCVVNVLTSLPERNRFVRGLRSWVGFRQIGLDYERDARFAGKPKYTFRKLVRLALDGLVSFSYLPLRLATMLGFGVSALSLTTAAYYLLRKLTIGISPPGFATEVVLISFLGGVQLITIGVVGEYIGHVLDEVKHRPAYVLREVMKHSATETDEAIPNAKVAHSDPG